MSNAFVYRYWSLDGKIADYSVLDHPLSSPIIASLATLRAVNDSVNIYVLDYSPVDIDWEPFQSLINFKVIKTNDDYTKKYSKWNNIKGGIMSDHFERLNFSREFDIWNLEIEEDIVVYQDADIFWFSNPLLEGDTNKFCWNGWNSGIYYYDKNSTDVALFFDLYFAYATVGMTDLKFSQEIRSYCPFKTSTLYDEPMHHFLQKKFPELVSLMPAHEHFLLKQSLDMPRYFPIKQPHNFHCNGFQRFDLNRGLVCRFFIELEQSLYRILGKPLVDQMYGGFNNPHQVEFSNLWNNKQFLTKFQQAPKFFLL